MAFVVKDRVKETTTTSGTGTVTLAGAVTGYQSFSVIGDGNDTYYTITLPGSSEWEVGVGKYTASGTTLSRDTVLSSSNSNNLVPFSAGTKDVFVVYPADKAVIEDLSNNVTLPAGLTVNGDTVISTNSTTDALRITQIGTGNALLVEDSANPDSTPVVVTNAGRLVIGHTTSIAGSGGVNSFYQQHGTSNAGASAGFYDWQNVAIAGPIYNFNKSKSGAIGTRGIVSSGDRLGAITFAGDDGTNFISAGQIACLVDGTPGTNDMPGRLTFSTTADGASTVTERMRIDNAGLTSFGIQANGGPALSTTVPAKLYLSTGTYTDTATAASGTVTHGTIAAFDNPAIAATNLTVTYTNASTLYIDGAPTAGTNVTITNPYALYVAAGTNYFAGNVGIGIAAPSVALDVLGTIEAQAALTQDAVAIAGRAGGTGSFVATITPTTLSASRTVTLPDANTNIPIATQTITFSGPSAARTYTFPDANATVLTTNAAVTVAQGGTGLTTLTANNVILGNGTSAVQFVAPGTSGNVLTSNGTTWTSAAPAVTLAGNNAFTGANTFYNATGQTFGTATSTQDGIIIAGSATGSATRRITVQPAANLSASRTLTLPDPGSNETLGYLNIPQNSQSAAYTLVLTDSGKHILHPSADTTARTFTIPANGTVAFPIGTAVTFINQNGAGVVTIAITTDTMRLAGTGTTGSRTLAANGIATAIKITSTEWIISGTGLT